MTTVEGPMKHEAEVLADFYNIHKWARCSCGWEGDSARTEHGALAEWAAHMHVVNGLATPDGGAS